MTDKTINILRNHWDSVREGKLPPFRSEISPRSLPDVLDTLFILEQLSPNDLRVRIAGLTICEMMGMEVRGQTPMTFFEEKARARFDAVVENVLTRPTIARLGLSTTDKLGNAGKVEMILLPLRSDFGDVNRIIGCVTVPKMGFTAPIRYKIDTIDLEPITRQNHNVLGFAEERAEFDMEGAPALRSINGNERAETKKPVGKPSYLKVVS